MDTSCEKFCNKMGWYYMKEQIDNIMYMLDWNNDKSIQKEGILLANKIDDISIFIQPDKFGNKVVWENCAKILSQKGDEQLEPYLFKLLEWLQDINWPGSIIILNRLKCYKGKSLAICLEQVINKVINSQSENDLMWLDYLSELLDNNDLVTDLSKKFFVILKRHYHNWGNWYEQ